MEKNLRHLRVCVSRCTSWSHSVHLGVGKVIDLLGLGQCPATGGQLDDLEQVLGDRTVATGGGVHQLTTRVEECVAHGGEQTLHTTSIVFFEVFAWRERERETKCSRNKINKSRKA